MYLDYASTTPVKEEVLDAMMPYLKEKFYNPSSLYGAATDSCLAINEARDIIAKNLNCLPEEIYFTGCGSESNSWIINSFFYNREGNRIISSAIEHHSVLNSLTHLKEQSMADVVLLPVDRYGIIDSEVLSEKLNSPDANFVSIMAVNNELGTIQPLLTIGQACSNAGIPFHTDAVQAFGHMPIDVKKYNISALSASGHKIGAPKGVGFLYVSNKYRQFLSPLIFGGQQEQGLRGGTENVASIVGLGKATELAFADLAEEFYRMAKVKAYFLKELRTALPEIKVNSSDLGISVPNIINLDFSEYGIAGEELMICLSLNEVYVSTGAACASHAHEPSHVLTAIGLSPETANSSIRISWDKTIQNNDIDALIKTLVISVKTLIGKEE